MKRLPACLLALLVMAPDGVLALGLGSLQQKSKLNEPFRATIELLGAKPSDLQSLSVKLADSDRFRRAGLERADILSQLRFEIVDDGGRKYIRVSSQQPIKEPFLNFLVDVNWSKGRLFREYTALLNPPLYDPAAKKAEQLAKTSPAPSAKETKIVAATETKRTSQKTYRAPVASKRKPERASKTKYTRREQRAVRRSQSRRQPGQFGPTRSGQTLGQVAARVRPNNSVSIEQMMLALQRANPNAFFLKDNINALKRGVVLQVPDIAAINTVNKTEAVQEVRQQYNLWEDYRNALAGKPTKRAAGSVASTGSAADTKPVDLTANEEARLKLVTADASDKAKADKPGTQPTANDATTGSPDADKLRNDLAVVNEQLESVREENSELKSKVSEDDNIIKLLQRQIEVKNAELAKLQAQLGKAPTTTESPILPSTEATDSKPVEGDTTKLDTTTPGQPEGQTPANEQLDKSSGPDSTAESEKSVETLPLDDQAGKTDEAEPTTEPSTETEEPSGLLPKTLVDSIPGGETTVWAGLAAAILALVAGFAALFNRGQSDEGEEDVFEGEIKRPENKDDRASDIGKPFEPYPEVIDDDDIRTVEYDGTGKPDLEQTAVSSRLEATKTQAEIEDPLKEVNIYLAYGRYDRAEELVKNALANDPNNLEYKTRLLEVYYASGNKMSYETTAKQIYDAVGGKGPQWESAVAMWREMSPHRALFEGDGEYSEVNPASSREFVDIFGEDGSSIPDFNAGIANEPIATSNIGDQSIIDVAPNSYNETSDEGSFVDVTTVADTASEKETRDFDKPLDIGFDVGPFHEDSPLETETHIISEPENISSGNINEIDKLGGIGEDEVLWDAESSQQTATTAPSKETVSSVASFTDKLTGKPPKSLDETIEFELADVDFETIGFDKDDLGTIPQPMFESNKLAYSAFNADDNEAQETQQSAAETAKQDESVFDQGMIPRGFTEFEDSDIGNAADEVDTKLNLAKAYIELGDADGARSILGEIAQEGSDDQKQEARQLIRQLG